MLLKNARILVVDDDPDILTAIRLFLKSKVASVVTQTNPNLILSTLKEQEFDLVILDMNYNGLINTGNEGVFWLKKIKEVSDDIEVILITAYADMELAIRSLKEGASDFIVKPWKNEKLLTAIVELLSQKRKGRPKNWTPTVQGAEIIGKSTGIQEVFFKVKKVAPTDANILLLGENGTGKDLLARAIHENSLRKDKPFIKVDVGALTETLFESELFGYKKGAFTDAREDRQGRFEAAQGGTVFLDEIANISLRQQARLLTVLQNRTVTPLGANTGVPIDIRLICATNVPLTDLADQTKFRKDLVYRINTVEITIPPLRERKEDIELLTRHFVNFYTEKYAKPDMELSKDFIDKLKSYSFPGNIRELQYALERVVIMADHNVLQAKDLVFSPIEMDTTTVQMEQETNLEALEKKTILKVIEKNQGNISKSAKELGLTRTALYRRMNKYGI